MPRSLGLVPLALLLAASPAQAAGVWPLGHFPVDAPLAQLGPRSAEAQEAERLMGEGEFDRAVRVLQRGLNQPDVTDDELVELYRLMGLAQLYLGNEDRAREAYEKLLQARPDYELPRSTAPKIRELYGRIREDIRKRRVRPVTIHFEPVREHLGGEPLEVETRVEDLALGARAKLYYRRAGAQAYSSVDFVREKSREDFRATIPAYELPAEARPYDIEYYLEVADAAQRRLAGRGDPFNPLYFTVRAVTERGAVGEAPDAWYRKPWVWVVGGVVVAGAAGGIAYAATRQPTGDLPVKIRVNP
jgi:tetratricopeptide (TPR) repeat protein